MGAFNRYCSRGEVFSFVVSSVKNVLVQYWYTPLVLKRLLVMAQTHLFPFGNSYFSTTTVITPGKRG